VPACPAQISYLNIFNVLKGTKPKELKENMRMMFHQTENIYTKINIIKISSRNLGVKKYKSQ
jgi:hypothetical protein